MQAANRPIIVTMNMWARDGTDADVAALFRYMFDIVSREPSCRLLRAQRSVSDPSHYLLYEEWDDHDEFVDVQLKRPYRREFAERMQKLKATDSKMEIFENIHER